MTVAARGFSGIGTALGAVLCGATACGEPAQPGGTEGDEDPSGDDGAATNTDDEPPVSAQNTCGAAPLVGAGRWPGTLHERSRDLGGACGLGGPDAFFRVAVPWRADVRVSAVGDGFVPRVGAIDDGCFDDWAHRQLLCTEGVGGWISDLAAGSEFVIAVGSDPKRLEAAVAAGYEDLRFEVEVIMRPVLGPHQPCQPGSGGRCASGSACLDGEGGWTCTPLVADTCDSAQAIVVAAGETTVMIDPGQMHTDAHAHGCGGARQRERVLDVSWPSSLAADAALTIRSENPDVGLAMRAPSCIVADEVACVDAGTRDASVLIDHLPSHGTRGFLFVELPGAADRLQGDEPPFAVVFTLASP